MSVSRTVSEIDGDFSRKSQNFPTPLFCAPAEAGFHWELDIGAEVKNYYYGATGPTKKFDNIFSHLDRMHERDRQTDGKTDGHSGQRPRLHIPRRAVKMQMTPVL